MNPALISELKAHLKTGLQEDSWGLDWTAISAMPQKTSLKKPKGRSTQAEIHSKSEGIWVGETLGLAVESLAAEMGLRLEVRSGKPEGAVLKKKDVVSRWSGDARAILAFERPFLNLASYMGGIAWQTHQLVSVVEKKWKREKLKGAPPRVTLTRKTLPGYRDVAIHSVIVGGGYPHRVSLAGGVLIKENHIEVAGSVRAAIERARAVAPHSLRVEIEVKNQKEFAEAIKAGAEIIMLDNFSPVDVRKSVHFCREMSHRPWIEVSGGINLTTVENFAIPGVDVISVGSITHSVQAVDLSLLIK